jgi:hypothetical protein
MVPDNLLDAGSEQEERGNSETVVGAAVGKALHKVHSQLRRLGRGVGEVNCRLEGALGAGQTGLAEVTA